MRASQDPGPHDSAQHEQQQQQQGRTQQGPSRQMGWALQRRAPLRGVPQCPSHPQQQCRANYHPLPTGRSPPQQTPERVDRDGVSHPTSPAPQHGCGHHPPSLGRLVVPARPKAPQGVAPPGRCVAHSTPRPQTSPQRAPFEGLCWPQQPPRWVATARGLQPRRQHTCAPTGQHKHCCLQGRVVPAQLLRSTSSRARPNMWRSHRV